MEKLKNIIDNNKYVKSTISNNKKEYNSLSYLINAKLSQSECIKLGIAIEKILEEIILSTNDTLQNIKTNNKKGVKERDHLFINKKDKIIYYAEIKSNLNLDTEKCKSTIQKCLEICNELKNEYPEYEIKMNLVGIRYYNKSLIPKNITKKYLSIIDNLIGINEYLNITNNNFNFIDEDIYIEFLNYLVFKMYDK